MELQYWGQHIYEGIEEAQNDESDKENTIGR
jgi:hypothetical protein